MSSWENLSCSEVLLQTQNGDLSQIDQQNLKELAKTKLAEVGFNMSPDEVVEMFLKRLPKIMKGKSKISRGEGMTLHIQWLKRRQQWHDGAYSKVHQDVIWREFANPEFQKNAKAAIRLMKKKIPNFSYRTTSILNDALFRSMRGRKKNVEGFETVEPFLELANNPFWMLFVVQVIREHWRRHKDEIRKRRFWGQILSNSINSANNNPAPAVAVFRRELERISERLSDPHRDIFDQCLVPLLLNDSINTEWLNDSQSGEYGALVEFISTHFPDLQLERAGRVLCEIVSVLYDESFEAFEDLVGDQEGDDSAAGKDDL